MPNYTKGFLQIPQGTEGIFLEEAYRHRRIVRSIEELFASWGYLPAQVPIFDFFDTYRGLIGERKAEQIYRLIDRDGDLLMLRSDITLFLAKQVGLALQAADLPLRICYADSILRHQDSEDISRNEFFQVGAELIGRDGIRGDVEAIALLSDLLGLLELPDVYIHLGSRSLFSAVAAGLEHETAAELAACIEVRDENALAAGIRRAGMHTSGEFLAALFLFIDEPAALKSLISQVPESHAAKLKPELEHLETIAAVLGRAYPDIAVRIDLSEIGAQDYYTGIVFQAYAAGADSAIASGGRYDELLGHFGYSCGSVGFSMFLRKIESLVGAAERFEVPEARFVLDEDLCEALDAARQVRSEGGIAIL